DERDDVHGPSMRNLSCARHLGDRERSRIVQSEIEGGVFLQQTVLEIQTVHRCYTAVLLGEGRALLSGHPEYRPEPVLVAIPGSTWGGSMLKVDFVGRGMPGARFPAWTRRARPVQRCAVFGVLPGIPPSLSPLCSRTDPAADRHFQQIGTAKAG